jgi:elongator complex protein 1
LGKAAASAAAIQVPVGSSTDDDGIPRISWRGDASYFAVSTLAPASSSHQLTRRIIRIYNPQGVLQSTSEAVAGLEHPLDWRPSGNLIAASQRFGEENGLGKGKKTRHDIVFFERNGLRHGEFTLPNERWLPSDKNTTDHGYRIRNLAWNSDSTILAIWITRDNGDIGMFRIILKS